MSSFMLNLEQDTEEILGFNPDADANALLPPVPAGTYYAKFHFTNPNEDVEVETSQGKELQNKRWATRLWGKTPAQKVLVTNITSELYNTDGGVFDGRTIRDGLVSTMIQQQTGTCRMQGVIQAVTGVFPPSCKTRPQFFQLLTETIGEDGAATGQVEVEWEASETLTEEERDALKAAGRKSFRVRGMKNFPVDKDGNHIPEVSHNGETYRAYNIISRYVTATVGGEGQQAEQAPVVPQQAPMRRTAAPQTATATQPPAQQAQTQGAPPVPPRAGAPRPRAAGAAGPQGIPPRPPQRAA